jgi:hypothetical protein
MLSCRHWPKTAGSSVNWIIGTKENAQLVQTWQIIGQRRERVARQIENFQRLGKIKNLARKRAQAARQFQSPAPRQFPAA